MHKNVQSKSTDYIHNYAAVPFSTLEGLIRYRDYRIPPGGFIFAVLKNDLFEAIGRADFYNKQALHDIIKFVYNELPRDIYGSPEQVKKHIEAHYVGN